MQCAHCGTHVNNGFTVCTGCGANAVQPAVALGYLVGMFGTFLLVMGLANGQTEAAVTLGGGTIIAGVLITKVLRRIAPITWSRRV